MSALPWHLLSVELAASGWILVLLAADLLIPAERKNSLWAIAMGGVVLCAALLVWQPAGSLAPSSGQHDGVFYGMVMADRFADYFKALFLLTTAAVILMTRVFRRHLGAHAGAFYLLLFTALLGMLVLSSINDLLMLFLGLELLTFSLYIMTAYLKSDARSIEAGMKYLILGSVSSGFVVYGSALLYGFAGGTGFSTIRGALSGGPASLGAQAGLLLILAGLGFKVAAVPFHLWVPDVYEGAPTPVVALLSVGSKMAGVVAMLRLLYGVFGSLEWLWAGVLATLSAATMLYGNLAAIPQTNIKRLMGYSSIGHAGYLLMGLSTGSTEGVQAVGYYLLAYLFSNLAVFFGIVVASEAIGGDALDNYQGLSRRSPLLAAVLFIGLLSLAGVPPLAGFVGKLFVLLAATERQQLWLVAIGAVNIAISLYYYLMVIKRMYLDTPRIPSPIPIGATTKLALGALTLGIFAIGVFQQPFLRQILAALQF